MSRRVVFVLAVDVDEKTVHIDDDTFTARFSRSEGIWDEDLDCWIDDDDEGSTYYEALRILNSKIGE